jgi:S-DNA-T family DNA segregation ATPase FtsK/SpoIIIE
MLDTSRVKTDLLAIGLFAAICFAAVSLYSYDPADAPSTQVWPQNPHIENYCGEKGATVAYGLLTAFGAGAWFLLVATFIFDLRLFCRESCTDIVLRMFGIVLMATAASVSLQLLAPTLGQGPVIGSGGYVGAYGRAWMAEHLSTAGSLIVSVTLFAAGLLLAADQLFLKVAYNVSVAPAVLMIRPLIPRRRSAAAPIAARVETAIEPTIEKPEPVTPPAPTPAVAAIPEPDEFEDLDVPPPAEPAPNSGLLRSLTSFFATPAASTDAPPPVVAPAAPVAAAGAFKVNPPVACLVSVKSKSAAHELPPIDLLEDAEEFPFELLAEKAQQSAAILERTFTQFGLKVKVTEISTGPVVTLFELDLEPGLRVAKVVTLQDDLAIALRVPAVRVVSPIPGKNTVGVEVPNSKRIMVRMRELMEAGGEDLDKLRIPLFLGKDVSGNPLVVDMAKMPHLLIAGRTGTGKSVCLNTLILSMLLTRTPDEVRLLMIDPKMVELSPYTRLPHLMHPVITDMKKAEAVLAWAVDKMEERYDLLAKVGVRHLDQYNKLGWEKILDRLGISDDEPEADDVPATMPYIVIIADEMADMIMTSGKDVEGHIIRLAQKSRAVGIHLVLATQKPTVDVITGLIKSNLPARIAFQVASKNDSRVVLDENGAERLLGYGDMLYLAPGTSSLSRAQGTYVSDDEVNSVIDFFADHPTQYCAEIEQATAKANESEEAEDGPRVRDPKYDQAVEIVIREGRGSCSLLQRCMGVGYGRASRMIDHMAADGIVGTYNGSKHRDVVCTIEQWNERKMAMADD